MVCLCSKFKAMVSTWNRVFFSSLHQNSSNLGLSTHTHTITSQPLIYKDIPTSKRQVGIKKKKKNSIIVKSRAQQNQGKVFRKKVSNRSTSSALSVLLAKRFFKDLAPILTKKAFIYEDIKGERLKLYAQISHCPTSEVERATHSGFLSCTGTWTLIVYCS